jgi:hypothetical protein
MIPIEPTQIYPCFFACENEAEFESLDTQACELLDFPNAGASDYCNPIIDVNGVYYFTVNPEVTCLFTEEQLDTCIPYEDIVLPTPEPIG